MMAKSKKNKNKKATTPEGDGKSPEETSEAIALGEVTEEAVTEEAVTEEAVTEEAVTEEAVTEEAETEEAVTEETEEAEEAKAKEAEEAKAKEAEEAKALAAERAKIQAVKYDNTSSVGEAEAEIVVIYDKANRLTLPYKNPEGKGGLTMCILNPGKNHVGVGVWKAIKEMQGEENWAHLSRHFQIKEIEGSERGSVSDLETSAFLDIIENTFTLPELENYDILERNKKTGEVRKGILAAIKKQIKKVEATLADIEKKKKKK